MNKRKIVGKLLICTLILNTMITGNNVVKASNIHESINKSSWIYPKSNVNNVSDEFNKLKLKECNSPKKIKEMSYDLNGDTIAEKISLYYSNTGICTVKVNNFSKNIRLESYLGEEYLKINVIELNKKEKIKELQFINSVENGYKQIVIFKFDGKNLNTLYNFNINNLITSMSFDGLGNIKTSCIKQSLYTLGCTENYKYDGKSIKYVEAKYHKLNTPTTVISPIKVQKSQSNKKDSFKLYKGEKVKIVLTDGKGWFKLINSKGKEGWFYYDKKTCEVQGKVGWEVFKNLPVAG